MAHPDPDGMRDDAPLLRAWEEGTWREQRKVSVVVVAREPVTSGADASAR